MNSESYRIFGSGLLLAKMKAAEEAVNRAYKLLKKVVENAFGVKPIVPELQESCEILEQCTRNMKNLSLAAETNPPISVVLLRDLPPIEAAFSLEKVSKKIFSLLDPPDLLRCRLVSSSWLRMATNDKLLKWNENALWIGKDLRDKIPAVVKLKSRRRRLKAVTDFLDSFGSHPILFSAELELEMTIAPNDFFEFFDSYGFIVNSLRIIFHARADGAYCVYYMDSLLEFVTKLLTEQMPNLQTLWVFFHDDVKCAGEIDPHILISIAEGLYCAGNQNQNLRAVEFCKDTPHELIEIVCCLAPKVEDFKAHDWSFWYTHKHRLNFLKTLNFKPRPSEWYEVDAVQAVIQCEEKISLKKLTLDFDFVRNEPVLCLRLKALVQKIFEKSSDSLEELHLYPIDILNGPDLPQMPRVKLLSLNCHSPWNPKWSFFPQGTSLATTFPNLQTIKYGGNDRMKITAMAFFLVLCKDEEVTSVKEIIVDVCDDDEKELQKRFPKAVVRRCNPISQIVSRRRISSADTSGSLLILSADAASLRHFLPTQYGLHSSSVGALSLLNNNAGLMRLMD